MPSEPAAQRSWGWKVRRSLRQKNEEDRRSEEVGPREPPADAFGVALRAAKQRGMEHVAFVSPLAIVIVAKNALEGRCESYLSRGMAPSLPCPLARITICTYIHMLAKGALLAYGARAII